MYKSYSTPTRFFLLIVLFGLLSSLPSKAQITKLSQADRSQIILSVLRLTFKTDHTDKIQVVIDEPLPTAILSKVQNDFVLISFSEANALLKTKAGNTYFHLGKVRQELGEIIVSLSYSSGNINGDSGFHIDYQYTKKRNVWIGKPIGGMGYCTATSKEAAEKQN